MYPVPSLTFTHFRSAALSALKFADVITTEEADRSCADIPTMDFLYVVAMDARPNVADPLVNATVGVETTSIASL